MILHLRISKLYKSIQAYTYKVKLKAIIEKFVKDGIYLETHEKN